jgi:hypothetical protein
MKRARPFLLLIALIAAFSVTCTDEPQLTEPPDEIVPSMARRNLPPPGETTELIRALYPEPGLVTSALNRWTNIYDAVGRGAFPAAQGQARLMITDALILLEDGQLRDPPGTVEGLDFDDTADGVRLLADFLNSYTDQELQGSADKVIDWIDLSEDGFLETENRWARFSWDAVEGGGEILASIYLQNPEKCDPADEKAAFGCWDFDQFGGGDFERLVEICVADNPDLTDAEYNLGLRVHKRDEVTGDTEVLPYEEATLDCHCFPDNEAEGCPTTVAARGTAPALLASIGSAVADLLLPDPLGAFYREDRRPPRGIGGTTSRFSDIWGAVPGSSVPASAQDALVSWWPANGDWYDLYGGNDGTPYGDVTFDSGMFGSAFSFDGDGDEVDILDLSNEVTDLQELTVATWVKLDPAGPVNQVQRFVTLGREKAVLRQEGWGGPTNRELHFYLHFVPDVGPGFNLEHIQVDNAFQTGCFHFFAGTYDGTDMLAYLDGVEVGAQSVPGGVVNTDPDIGKFGASGGAQNPVEELYGDLDDVMVFDRALTPTEIQAIYDDAPTLNKCQPPASLILVSGDGQTAEAGSTLPSPLVVQVENAMGNPMPGVGVHWEVTGGDGSVSAPYTVTNAAGQAQVSWTLGSAAGPNSVTATVLDVTPVTFTATAVLGSISGGVSLDGEPLAGITLTLTPSAGTMGAVTNSLGNYYFGNLPAGTYTVTVTTTGYSTWSRTVVLAEGQDATADFHGGFPMSVDPLSISPPLAWTMGGPTTVSICNGDGATPCAAATTVTVEAVAMEEGAIATGPPTWNGGVVRFYVYHPTLGFHTYIGSVAGSSGDLTDNGVNHFWTYSITFDATGFPTGAVEVVAVAEDSGAILYRTTDVNTNITIVEGY